MRRKPTYEELVQKIDHLEAKLGRNKMNAGADQVNDVDGMTDTRAAGNHLHDSKEMMRLVIDNIPQFIFWKDRNSVYLGCNKNFARAAGVEHPEAIEGKTDYDLSWKLEEADFFRKCDQRVMENNAPEYHILEPQLQAGGRQSWLDTNKIPLHDHLGNVVGILGTYEDVTERMVTRKTLEFYDKIVATTDDLMSIIDTDYVFQAVNDAYLKAHCKERNEIVGHTVAELLGRDVFEQHAKPHLKTAFAGEVAAYDAWFEFPGMGKRYMHVSYYPHREKRDEIKGVVVHVRDITRIKKLEAMLAQSQKMKAIGTLAGGIAHDFNNILGAIMGYAQLAQIQSSDSAKVEQYIDQLCTASNRAKELVQQILDFSRQSNSEKMPMDLGVVVKEALKLLRASLPATIQISRKTQSNLGIISANQTQIHQIVMNLCTNAFHAMDDNAGGRLDVELSKVNLCRDDSQFYQDIEPGRYLKLAVSDSGHGMDSDTIARIFDPYFTTKGLGEGTGMGLATVYGIVKDHGGHIKVYSEPGIGTSFHILFPEIEGGLENPSEGPASLPHGDAQILLVDDEIPILDTTKQFLEHLGYRVEAKTDPCGALEAFQAQTEKYDIVITDLTMPEMTGDNLAKKIRKTRPDIPIILCTGFSERLIQKNTAETIANSIVMKPVTLDALAKEVRKVLDSVRKHCHMAKYSLSSACSSRPTPF